MEKLRQGILEAFKGPPLNWFEPISEQHEQVPWIDLSYLCAIGSPNDEIGNIIKVYNPPDYGADAQEVVSDSGDYTLRYTITAKRVE
jgi:hypothetical protein